MPRPLARGRQRAGPTSRIAETGKKRNGFCPAASPQDQLLKRLVHSFVAKPYELLELVNSLADKPASNSQKSAGVFKLKAVDPSSYAAETSFTSRTL